MGTGGVDVGRPVLLGGLMVSHTSGGRWADS